MRRLMAVMITVAAAMGALGSRGRDAALRATVVRMPDDSEDGGLIVFRYDAE